MFRETAETAATVVLIVVVVSLLAGQLLGQPVLLGFVTTDSMEPQLSPGDGFLTVPSFVAGEPSAGDVVVFNARELHDGGLTTHRIVGETEGGFVTKGDANPFTDQDGGEPPVTEGQIVAHVVQMNGEVVVVPELGTVVMGVRSALAYPLERLGAGQAGTGLVVVGGLLFVLAGLFGGEGRDTRRTRKRGNVVAVWAVVLFAVLIVAGAATVAMVVPAGVHEFGLLSTTQPTEKPQVVEPGTNATVGYEVHNGGVLPMLVLTDPASQGVAVDPGRVVLQSGDRVTLDVTMTAPESTGIYLRHVHESRYLVVLPPDWLATLHAIHPLVALLAVDAVVASLVLVVSVGVFGTGHLRLRGNPDVPFGTRLQRRMRRWW